MSYNGWTNYETWSTSLWVDNEEAMYRDRVDRLSDIEEWTATLAKEFVEEYFPDGNPDIQTLPYDEREKIDWKEIADNWNEEER